MVFSDLEVVVQRAAGAFRMGMEAQGSQDLVALIDVLPLFLDGTSNDMALRVNQLLATMLEAQGRKDYLHLADLLEYELLRLLAAEVQ